MKTMKVLNNISSRLVIMAALAIGAFSSAAAQEEYPEKLSVEPITVAPGEEAEVVVNYESAVERSGYNIDITLPEGLSFVKVMNEDTEEEETITLGSSATKAHMKDETFHDDGARIRLTVFHLKEKGLKDGVLFSFKVKADENLAETSEIKFGRIAFNGGKYLNDFTCAVTKSQATGISDAVVAGSESEVVYNMAGQRVSGKAKGIVIKNGKKVINK